MAAAGKLSPETYTELALSCGLIATWVDVKIKTIVPAMLPAIVSLKDGRAVILTDISSDRSGFVVTHSDESVTSLTYEKLSALADEKILSIGLEEPSGDFVIFILTQCLPPLWQMC